MPTIIDGISHVNNEELYATVQNPTDDTILIDVREHHEYIEGHIPGIPLIPMGEIASYINDFDKSKEYIFVCRSGRRSYDVANFFKRSGFDQVHNYLGGMLEWEHEVTAGPENIIEEFNADQLKRV